MTHELDPVTAVSLLRGQGVEPFDPIRLHFLEALALRTQAQQGAVKHLLEDKLSRALQAYQERLKQARESVQSPQSLPPQRSTLAELTHILTHHLPQNAQASMSGSVQERAEENGPELKSLRYFRDTWSKLSVERQLTQAIAQGPENAGPLNSHQLMLRSLSVMRDISPDYLNRFMHYADALLWLDQADAQPVAKSTVKSSADNENGKKRKTSGVRTRQVRPKS